MKTDFSDILKNRKENILKSYNNVPLGKAMDTGSTPGKETTFSTKQLEVKKADEEADNTDEEMMKAKSDPKFKKVMDEWKAGTLKTSAGEKVEDQKQAEAIAFSESNSVKKALDLLCDESIEKAEKKEVKKDSKKPEPKDDKFDHHRKMAGYHHLKAKAATDSAFDLNNSSDKDIQGKASESSKVAQHHTKMMEEHMERSKQLHDKEKHGDWNKTIPSASEAMVYGKKYDEDLNATKDSDKAVIEKKDNVKKALDILNVDYFEKAEGSHGGKVIGHTKSGKPIYDSADHEGHKSFNIQDHSDAINIHHTLGYKASNKKREKHYNMADKHRDILNIKQEKE